jgi:ATP-dependent Lhr-like helicase
MQLVVHAPFGARINRGLGLAVRKRICRTFDFELQAAANDDSVVLSLGPQHSFPLPSLVKMLSSNHLEEALRQAVLASPMFTARWRWNLGRALAVLRFRGGKKNPFPIQRMEADDLMASIFPGVAQCQENQAGPIEIPDHPLVRQTMDDCLGEAMDVEALGALFRAIEADEVRVHSRETTEPSPLCHEILNGRPFTFLDDAPLEERRTRAVTLRRGLPEDARDLGRLDADAIGRVRDEARCEPRDAEELHDALLGFVVRQPEPAWEPWFEALVREGRAAAVETPAGTRWLATEERRAVEVLFPGARITPDVALPPSLREGPAPEEGAAAAEAVRGHLDATGPCTLDEIARDTGLRPTLAERAVALLEAEGFLLRGRFDVENRPDGTEEFCARRLLARIHIYTQERLRREIEPVTAQDFMRFLLRWHHVAPGTKREGRRGVLAVVEQLQGFELATGAWEEHVLPARVDSYRAGWLDDLCLSGEVVWGRVGVRTSNGDGEPGRGGAVPSRATPITLAVRDDLPWLLAAARGEQEPALPGEGAARDLLALLQQRGALFHGDLVTGTNRLPIEVEQGLWDLVSRGLVAADGFQSLRGLLASRGSPSRQRSRSPGRGRLRRGARGRVGAEGRWALLPPAPADLARDELAQALAEQLLARWGVVFRDVVAREGFSVPWRDLLYALRRMEARGTIRGGRFVTGFVGEQYALPGAVDALRRTRKLERNGEQVRLSAADPLNLVGILTPGPRVPAVRTGHVIYRDGVPVEPEGEAVAAFRRGR